MGGAWLLPQLLPRLIGAISILEAASIGLFCIRSIECCQLDRLLVASPCSHFSPPTRASVATAPHPSPLSPTSDYDPSSSAAPVTLPIANARILRSAHLQRPPLLIHLRTRQVAIRCLPSAAMMKQGRHLTTIRSRRITLPCLTKRIVA